MLSPAGAQEHGRLAHFTVGVLLAVLVCVPALIRANQLLQVGPVQATQSAGFHKSVESAPDPVQPTTDSVVVYLSAFAPLRSLVASRPDDDCFPALPILSDCETLRAPPTSLSL